MADYILTLKNEKSVLYHRLGVFFIITNIVFWIYLAFFSAEKRFHTPGIVLLVLLCIVLLLQQYCKITRWQFGLYPYFFIIMLAWVYAEFYWMMALTLIFGLLYNGATMKKTVFVSKSHIIYPSLPKKKFLWPALNNVMLRDGLLTIDCANNKIIQQLVDENATIVNEKEFNDFCRQQLSP